MRKSNLKSLRHALEKHGVISALALLNDGVAHRYTGLYVLQNQALSCLVLYDQDGMHYADSFAPAPLATSFCEVTLREGFFQTSDAANDARLTGRKVRNIVAYHAVALGQPAGRVGTLAHFDDAAQLMSPTQFDYLRDAGRLLSSTLEPFAPG